MYGALSEVTPTHSVKITLFVQTGFALAVVGTATSPVVVIARTEAIPKKRFFKLVIFFMS
jgi:hypothetical protein